jgi:hypothetical protein
MSPDYHLDSRVPRSDHPHQDRLFELKSGPCSGALIPRTSANAFDDQLRRRRERYRKEGWSDAKITRALDAARIAHRGAVEKYSAPELALPQLFEIAPSPD